MPAAVVTTLNTDAEDIIASGRPTTRNVLVDTGARDGGPGGGDASTTLYPGCMLTRITASGNYSDFDNDAVDGTEFESETVILLQVVDTTLGDQNAVVAVDGHFIWDKLRWATSGDESAFVTADSNFAFKRTP